MPKWGGGGVKCKVCGKSVYANEKIEYDGMTWHESCFKCTSCKCRIQLTSVAMIKGVLYCKPCFKKKFQERGKYDDFGDENKPQPKKKKGDGAALEDSNCAALGSKLNRSVKLEAAKGEEAWNGCGQKPGVEIWRIEKFKVKHWPKDQYGTFYDGDSYIVLNTYKVPDVEKLLYNVHFWLGKDTSQDEQGTAAYKTVELDDLLGDLPVQYREVQGSETDIFLDLFGGNITLLRGGIDSGFNRVKKEDYKPRLLQCKGKRNRVRVTEVDVKLDSLNHGDVFLLDTGMMIYEWHGKGSGVSEKNKGRDIRMGLVEQRGGKPKNEVVDGVEDNEAFWKVLNDGNVPGVDDIKEATPDEEVKKVDKRLFKVSEDSGELEVTEEKEVSKDVLESDDVYLLDVGNCLYCWIGKTATKSEKAKGMEHAVAYLSKDGRTNSCPVVRCVQGANTMAFDKALE